MHTDPEKMSDDTKQRCIELIERGMSYCDDCTSESTEDIFNGVCEKHMRMYSKLNP